MTAPTRSDLPRLDLGLAAVSVEMDVLLCDVWGVVHNGVRHHSPAVDALGRFRQTGGTVVLVTNAPTPEAQVQARLDRLAVPRECYDRIATSGDVTADLLVAAGCPPVVCIGPEREPAICREAARRGPRAPERVDADAAEMAVCIGLDATGDRPEDYDPLLAGLRARRLPLVCANPDLVVEVGDTLIFCAGAIAARYAAMGGEVVQAGKPHPAIYDRALAMAAAIRGPTPRHRILAIGDAAATDLAGAARQGVAALFITAGIHRDRLHGASDGRLDRAALADLLDEHGTRADAALPRLSWTGPG